MWAPIKKSLWIFLLPTIGYSQGVELSQCQNNVTEVTETGTTSITCSGLDRRMPVTWTVELTNGNIIVIGNCDSATSAMPWSCTPGSLPGVFTSTRPTSTTSVMTINPSAGNNGAAFVAGRTLKCFCPPSSSTVCRMDYVHSPDTVSCSAQFLTPSDAAWSVSGRCDVTKVYSYLGRYTCQWYQQRGSSSEIPLGQAVPIRSSPVTEGKYINGSCDVTETFPVGDGQYSYRVVITPSGLNHNATVTGTSLIRQPSPTHDCPRYVTDGQNLSCTCSDDVGSPPGVAQWSSNQSPQLTVNSSMDRQQQTCHVIYNNQTVSPVTYTVERAYGPSNVAITGTSPFDTNGSQTLTLTCTVPGGSNPDPTFQWTRPPSPDVIHQAQTYTFQPQVSEDGVELSCTARNNFTSASDTDTFPADLNFPPTNDPAITDNSTDSHLYQGDSVTLTCEVEGGKPVSATTLTFTCPGKDDGSDITGSTMVSSTVTFSSLSSDDHDDVCTCRTKWKSTDWYSKTSTRKLFVNSPPSIPTIQAHSGREYPFIVTMTQPATLTCNSSTPGRPAANYTWPVNHGGTDVSGNGTLTFDTISKEHNGKVVSCRAGNRYTAVRRPVPDGSLTLEVYYHPEVHLVPVKDNQCQPLTSDPSHCLVTEGQSVHFRCKATSKPDPAVFTWQPGDRNNTDLFIESANRTLHTGTFNCSVETGLGSYGNDPRLPLRNSMPLTVLVTYTTAISSLTVNSVTSVNLTVNASDTVTLTCLGNGRPSPEMTLFSATKDAIGHIAQGKPSLEDKVTEVTGNVTTQCRDTGYYTCEASNGLGENQTRRVSVFVRCKPEVLNNGSGDGGSMEIPSVDFVTKAVRVHFHFAAYPTPELSDVKYFPQRPNATSVGRPVKENAIQVACSRHSDDLFNVTCTVTVDNITSADAGFYQAVIGNDLGDVKVLLHVTTNDATTIFSLTVNSVTSVNLTVNASDTVTLTCRGNGRPSPEMTLFNATKDAIGHIPQGTPALEDKITEVTGSITAQCRDTGIYTCEASNGVGEKQTRRVTVFVRCKPEVLDGGMKTPSVDFTTKPVRLNFHFAAYPPPQLSDIRFFPQRPNATSVGKPLKGVTIQVACLRHLVDLFNVTCAVTVDNITSLDAGFYQAVFSNSLGNVKVLFEVTFNAFSRGDKEDSSLGVGAAVGVSVTVMLVIVVVFFVWLWRRHWVLPCAAAAEREADVRLESRHVEPAQGIEHHGQGQSDDYEIQNIESTTASEYASLRVDEIGLRSLYSKITPTYINTGTAANTSPVYENTDVSTRSPYVNASDYRE